MKVIYILCLALSAACLEARLDQLRQETNSNLCPVVDPRKYTIHLPHPRDCNMFLRCDHGIAKPERCPSNLHFNPILQVCDWPANAGCVKGLGTGTSWGDSNSFDRNDGPLVEGHNSQPEEASQEQLIPDGGNSDAYIPNEWIQSGSIPAEDVQSGQAPDEDDIQQNGQVLGVDDRIEQTSGANLPDKESDDIYIQNEENQRDENDKTPIFVDVLDEEIFPDTNPE